MKKQWLNGGLILAVVAIYLAIADQQWQLFPSHDAEALPGQEVGVKSQPSRRQQNLEFKHARNYFQPPQRPRKQVRVNKSVPEKFVTQEPLIPIDTLAVIGSAANKKYLLRQGGKTWIE
jgi:hypothetical protein